MERGATWAPRTDGRWDEPDWVRLVRARAGPGLWESMAARHLNKVRDLLPKNTGEGGTEYGHGV